MEIQILIIGDRNLQNQLIQEYLKQIPGVKCRLYSNISLSFEEKNELLFSSIILLDSRSEAFKSFLNKMNSRLKNCNYHFVIYNLSAEFNLKRDLLDKGLRGVFFENDSPELISRGVKAISKGELWFSRDIMKKFLMENTLEQKESSEKIMLSFREREILIFTATGMSNAEVAEKLCISINTVKTHLYKIYKKINVSNRLQAALWVAENL